MTKETAKQILHSILVGLAVAFISSLAEGLIDWVRGMGNNLTGGVVAGSYFMARRRIG